MKLYTSCLLLIIFASQNIDVNGFGHASRAVVFPSRSYALDFHQCSICTDECEAGSIYRMSCCNRRYCQTCLTTVLRKVGSYQNLTELKCPTPACRRRISAAELNSMAAFAPQDVAKIQEFLRNINVPGSGFTEHTRRCPNCNVEIYRFDGCIHMTCKRCEHEFCWECLEPCRAVHVCAPQAREIVQARIASLRDAEKPKPAATTPPVQTVRQNAADISQIVFPVGVIAGAALFFGKTAYSWVKKTANKDQAANQEKTHEQKTSWISQKLTGLKQATRDACVKVKNFLTDKKDSKSKIVRRIIVTAGSVALLEKSRVNLCGPLNRVADAILGQQHNYSRWPFYRLDRFINPRPFNIGLSIGLGILTDAWYCAGAKKAQSNA